MKIYVSQIYPEAGISFPFKHQFQKYLSEAVNAAVCVSPSFAENYGRDYDLIFRISAKEGLAAPEIKGPTVFKRDKDVEYTIFLPFDRGAALDEPTLTRAIELLISSMTTVLDKLGMNASKLADQSSTIVRKVLEGDGMIG